MQGHPRILVYLGLTAGLIIFGTAGYMLFEHLCFIDALFMTVTTLTTVGYGEVRPFGPTGRIFSVALILFGVSLSLYVVGRMAQFLVEGEIREVLGRRRLDRQISRLKDHYIVCGYGRIGKVLCRFLQDRNRKVVVIEQDPELADELGKDGVLHVIGSATDEANLERVFIGRAKALLSVLATDADNVFLVLTAKQINPKLFIAARATRYDAMRTLYAAGADKVISPYELGARRMAHAILRPTVIHFLELAFADRDTDIQIEEILVTSESRLVNKTLMESEIRKKFNLIVLTIQKADGSMVFNPGPNTRIEPGDTFVVVGQDQSILGLERILHP
jgi:voltage-gated potassium channel